jgi:hypothetical protein
MGETNIFYLQAYDAGTEENNQSCAFIPAPPCNSHQARSVEGAEGFVSFHPGIFSGGDLMPMRDAFNSNVARVTVKRTK